MVKVALSFEGPPPDPPQWYRLRYRGRDESGFGRGSRWGVMHFRSIAARQHFQTVWGLDLEMTPLDGTVLGPGSDGVTWE